MSFRVFFFSITFFILSSLVKIAFIYFIFLVDFSSFYQFLNFFDMSLLVLFGFFIGKYFPKSTYIYGFITSMLIIFYGEALSLISPLYKINFPKLIETTFITVLFLFIGMSLYKVFFDSQKRKR